MAFLIEGGDERSRLSRGYRVFVSYGVEKINQVLCFKPLSFQWHDLPCTGFSREYLREYRRNLGSYEAQHD